MKKNAVIISCFDWYEKRLEPIAKILSEKYNVKIYLSDYSHIEKKYIKNHTEECEYIHTIQYKRNLSVRRVLSHFFFAKSVYLELCAGKPELIYALIPPNFVPRYCKKYVKKNQCQLYFDVIDMWPESFPNSWIKKLFFFKMWASLRNRNLPYATHVFTECDFYVNTLAKYVPEENMSTLYLYKEQSEKETELINQCLKQRHNVIEDKIIKLGYVGSINNIIDIETISELISSFVRNDIIVDFSIIGEGEGREELVSSCEAAGANVHFYGKIFDEEEKINILGKCDYGINVMKDTVLVGLSIKSIDYFSYGMPIINSIKGDTWNLVEKDKLGINYNKDTFFGDFLKTDSKLNRVEIYNTYNMIFSKNAFIKKLREFF